MTEILTRIAIFPIIFGAIVAIMIGLGDVESAPAWADGLTNYVFPAIYMLAQLPLIGTLTNILFWVLTFEAGYFILRLILRLAEWTKITGASFLP